eukprot:7378113-Prymnesium_polylepis.1
MSTDQQLHVPGTVLKGGARLLNCEGSMADQQDPLARPWKAHIVSGETTPDRPNKRGFTFIRHAA